MNNFEFISYQETPNDKYGMLGIVTVCVYGKVILKYKKMLSKQGGDFFASPSYTIETNGEKKYVNSHMLNSRIEDELLLEFIREKCHEYDMKKSAHRIVQNNPSAYSQAPQVSQYVAPKAPEVSQDELPF